MYLSKLEIFGFKSFANRTVINFTKGITGIVGPNGCGKTNIVDALRWALGEQKTSMLRSDKMENVIFNGTRNRKPMGMSEVSLTLVNDSGILPTEYNEVTITRRIYRSGESEYLLNKNICRLKDITSLFMDTGMSTNAYSVIELKMVENILNDKTGERRSMFEEAAGVNKYKLRRRLSLKKLDEVKGDLVRVNDIVAEVEKTVASLERQAKKADRYNQISSLLREKELDLSEREFAKFTRQIEELKGSKDELLGKKDKVDEQIQELEGELLIFSGKIETVEIELSDKREEITDLTDDIHNLQKNISVGEERIKSLNLNKDRFHQEIEELKLRKHTSQETIDSKKDNIETIEQEISNISEELDKDKEEVQRLKQTLDTERERVKQQNNVLNQSEKELNKNENEIANMESALRRFNNEIEGKNSKIAATTNKIAKSVGYLEELSVEKEQAEKTLKDSEDNLVAKQKEKDELLHELQALRDKELEIKGVISSIESKMDFMETLISNLEGASSGSRMLVENKEWSDGEKTFIADVGSAKDDYRFALEAALKNVLNNLLIEDFSELEKAVAHLKNNELGKASFYLMQFDKNISKSLSERFFDFSVNRRAKKLAKEPGFVGWAHDFVETDGKWKEHFEKLLGQTAVVEDLSAAIELHRKYRQFNFTTLEGDILGKTGIVEAGSLPKSDETQFGRRQLIENMKRELPRYQENLSKTQLQISDTENTINSIDLKSIQDQNKILLNDITTLEKQISQFEFERKKADEEIENLREEINTLAEKSNSTDNELSDLKARREELKSHDEIAQQKLTELESALASAEDAFNEKQEEVNRLNIELERFRGNLQNTRNEIELAEEAIISIDETIEKRNYDITQADFEIVNINKDLDSDQIEFENLSGQKSRLTAEQEQIERQLRGLREESSKFQSELNELRSDRQRISDSIHDYDIRENKISLSIESLLEHIQEEYTITLELKEFEDEAEFDYDGTRREVNELKTRLKNLGPINLLAYSEFEEEKERLDFLHQQRDDLIDSEKDLVNTIEEINTTATNLFAETFEAIRQNFIRIFQTLFNPGDEADLILQEGVDPLEAKIEILAKPKGKRPTSIELLSGGEKTLTATALLFAIYLVKPSPFCILDEVDAPLDDANVDRFTKLLDEFSKNTQFIIVTHNKRTMEAGESMYGVTMQEEGISKIASVRFTEDAA